MKPARIIIMGVSGSGKSAVGKGLAALIGATFIDGDDLHPAANIARMSHGLPLRDEDRWPWLGAIGERLAGAGGPVIIACSALKRSYRDAIRHAAGGPVLFIHLAGSHDLIAARMGARRDHFMPASLLESQFAALEPPTPDEGALVIDISPPVDEVVATIAGSLKENGT